MFSEIWKILSAGYAEVIQAVAPDVEQVKTHLAQMIVDAQQIEAASTKAVADAVSAAKQRAGL